ncbi:hypothetical protein AXZ07_20170 [Pseudomonas mosselii]|nr:hypothetical protein AXZ07_20170 [Pseudomonas mosselii]
METTQCLRIKEFNDRDIDVLFLRLVDCHITKSVQTPLQRIFGISQQCQVRYLVEDMTCGDDERAPRYFEKCAGG